ncbi:TetR/AcrR family transcriptional regulator [Streptomyces sp. NPDC059176]|uniref:TetR/AcrR family transcriptional regulator n=1 Tax=unclassified Streptomyces TaxID=2593676 RepID=UPI0036CEB0D1
MATQEERRRITRRKIMDAARDLFVRRGIEATTTEALLGAAGVSRGAMYHHFDSREDLVAAVYEEEAAAAIARAADGMPEGASRERLITGCLAWLDQVSQPETARILIEDGPAALGWRRCRRIEEQYSLGRVRAELQRAVDTGEIRVASVELTARLMNAVVGEAALVVVGANDRAKVRADVEATLRALLSGLTPPSKT